MDQYYRVIFNMNKRCKIAGPKIKEKRYYERVFLATASTKEVYRDHKYQGAAILTLTHDSCSWENCIVDATDQSVLY